MAKLAIKGHPTRGKEVIQLLEMLGADRLGYKDTFVGFYYYIECDAIVSSDECPIDAIVFTLEEFEEKFPYKVGDVVVNHKYGKGDITQMLWIDNEIVYEIHFEDYMAYCKANELCKYDAFKGLLLQELTEYLSHATREELDKTMEEIEIALAPFKVGDKVIVKGYEGMGEDEIICVFKTYDGDIKYKTKNHLNDHYFMEDSLMKVGESNKEETMEEKGDKAKAPVLTGEDYSGKRFGYKIPNGYEFDCIKNNEIILTPKQTEYPKTYEECCEVLGISDNRSFGFINLSECENTLMSRFIQLKRCRDAYWKIAGEQLGLGKPWEPDWNDLSITYESIKIKKGCFTYSSRVLVFPTAEMRDAFYENFKDLIEQCKELL